MINPIIFTRTRTRCLRPCLPTIFSSGVCTQAFTGAPARYRTINDDSVDEYVPIVCDGAQPPNCRLATNETVGGGGVPGVAVSIRWNDPSALTLPVLPVTIAPLN
jgi:hypothetical protein